ncbi:recombinase family protein [Salisediminibacterium selenitireducens]|uniref:Resolvase domain protein n=1 Tax=Bacillus selenitireducens (strain ATCC 700615 / DSM 15326 / MLS10) TaxID=439292 RepID=D6XZW2_BACIE|nr:recombinase family protein [Salisediminibacterium selenitireducens]ADI00464.1 Resolvase domain protein [[Bacillus] selenitireducens MLS10]
MIKSIMTFRIIPAKSKEQTRLRVCAYVRVSTQMAAQGESFDQQITHYTNRFEADPAVDFMGVFSDYGLTGTTVKRPGFQAMMDQARAGKIDVIYTKAISRFARNTQAMLESIRELRTLNVAVRFEKEQIDTRTGDGELMLTVLSSFAQEESENISQNVRWSIQRKFQKGLVVLNTERFFGYEKVEGILKPIPEEAEVIKSIYDAYLEGQGTHRIAKNLNEAGVPTISGKPWRESSILYLLENEKYKGDLLQQKTYTPGVRKGKRKNQGEVEAYLMEDHHEPIVSKDMWQAVQEERLRRKRNHQMNKRYPASGKLHCSKCGGTLRRRIWNKGKPYETIVWQCSTYIQQGKSACEGTTVKDEALPNLDFNHQWIVEEANTNGENHYRYTRKE